MRTTIAAGVAAVALAAGGVVAGTQLTSATTTSTVTVATTTTPPGCNDWPVQLTTGECQAAGTIRYVALINLQGAAQFCKWRSANPGEWSRLKGYASSGTHATGIVTWLGASVLNDLEAYFVTGAPAFTMGTNNAPNACRTPITPPIVGVVVPGQTDATVTIQTTG